MREWRGFRVIHNLQYKNNVISKFTIMVSAKTACHPNPALWTVCTWLTCVISFVGSTGAGLRSGGSMFCACNGFFVFDRSLLLGGPSSV